MIYVELPASTYIGVANNKEHLAQLLNRTIPQKESVSTYFAQWAPVHGMPFSSRLLVPVLRTPPGEYFARLSVCATRDIAREFFCESFNREVRRSSIPVPPRTQGWAVHVLLYEKKNAALVNATWVPT